MCIEISKCDWSLYRSAIPSNSIVKIFCLVPSVNNSKHLQKRTFTSIVCYQNTVSLECCLTPPHPPLPPILREKKPWNGVLSSYWLMNMINGFLNVYKVTAWNEPMHTHQVGLKLHSQNHSPVLASYWKLSSETAFRTKHLNRGSLYTRQRSENLYPGKFTSV